jgi:hypothetical protein
MRGVGLATNALFVVNPGVAHICKTQNRTGHSYLAVCVEMEKMQQIASQIS